MTNRLYYDDSYAHTFVADVIEVSPDGLRAYLDRTAFYPTSGGQPHDLGSLGDARVVDVIDEGERIAHCIDRSIAPGPTEGKVDWERRFDHMQQHTGQHLLSALLADLYDMQTVSVHFGATSSTLDVQVPAVDGALLREVERHANRVVEENRTVRTSYEDAANAVGLRKASDRTGILRIVSIEGIDRSACGGTHVRHTGEVGPVLLRRAEKAKQGTRIEFVCGMRAVQRARADYDLLAGIAAGLSASIDDLGVLVPSVSEQLRTSEQARRRLDDELAGYQSRQLVASTTPNDRGVRWIIERRAAGRADEARALAIAVSEHPKAVFVVLCSETRSALMSASADCGVNAGAVLKELLQACGGKGGGSARLAQGTVPSEAALHQLFDSLGPLTRQ